jgi:hypothetical protein
MVHESQLRIPGLTVCFDNWRVSASEQSTSPAIVRECSNMFACGSIWLVVGASV